MEIIRKYNIEFPALRRSQDIVFNYRYYNHINSLKSINYQGYQYRINKSSYASKLPENYYCIIGQIYSEIKSLHDSWNITLEDTTLSNICFSSIINYIESMIIRNHKYSQNLNNPIIKHIIETADPHNIYKKIIHLLLKKKLYFIVNLIIKSKILAKRIYY